MTGIFQFVYKRDTFDNINHPVVVFNQVDLINYAQNEKINDRFYVIKYCSNEHCPRK